MIKWFPTVRSILAGLGVFQALTFILGTINENLPLPYWLFPVISVPIISLFYALEKRFQRDT
jgi:hypothetical protein